MPPIVLFALQALFLLLLYLFVARAVRAVLRDLHASAAPSRRVSAPPPRPAAASRPAGHARRGSTARQLVVHRPDGKPEVVPLDGAEVRFGRNRQCDVVLDDSYVSDRHTRVFPREGAWMVADMGSTNGTYLNRQRVSEPSPLSPGDQLTIGKTVVEVRK
jgi:hypothetical protein